MSERIPHADTEVRQAFQKMEARVSGGSDPGHTHTGASLSDIDISDDTNLAATAPIVLTGDTLSLNQAAVDHNALLNTHNLTTDIDHGSIGGLAGDDHVQYHNDARGDARYYTEIELDAGQLDTRYFTEAEHLASSAGAADAGKPIILDAAGYVDATMINDGDVDHANLANVTSDQHHAESHNAASHSDITATGAQIDAAVAASHAEAHNIASHNDTTATGAELETLTDNSMADALHRHSELVASDGAPDPALAVDAAGAITIGGTLGVTGAITGPNVTSEADPGHTHTAYSTTDEKVKVDAAATAGYLGVAAGDGVLRTNAAITWADGGNFVTLSCNPGYVDRGDPGGWDFEGIDPVGDFVCDAGWHDLSLVDIVPAGAYAVHVGIRLRATTTGSVLTFIKKGNTGGYNALYMASLVANTVHQWEGVIACDANRKLEYYALATVNILEFLVKGYYI